MTPKPGADLAVIGLATIALVVGEAAALHITSTGQPTDVHHAVVTVALATGTSAIFHLLVASRMLENAWLLAHRRAGVVLIVAYAGAPSTACSSARCRALPIPRSSPASQTPNMTSTSC